MMRHCPLGTAFRAIAIQLRFAVKNHYAWIYSASMFGNLQPQIVVNWLKLSIRQHRGKIGQNCYDRDAAVFERSSRHGYDYLKHPKYRNDWCGVLGCATTHATQLLNWTIGKWDDSNHINLGEFKYEPTPENFLTPVIAEAKKKWL
jgi:hypothetical protein